MFIFLIIHEQWNIFIFFIYVIASDSKPIIGKLKEHKGK